MGSKASRRGGSTDPWGTSTGGAGRRLSLMQRFSLVRLNGSKQVTRQEKVRIARCIRVGRVSIQLLKLKLLSTVSSWVRTKYELTFQHHHFQHHHLSRQNQKETPTVRYLDDEPEAGEDLFSGSHLGISDTPTRSTIDGNATEVASTWSTDIHSLTSSKALLEPDASLVFDSSCMCSSP